MKAAVRVLQNGNKICTIYSALHRRIFKKTINCVPSSRDLQIHDLDKLRTDAPHLAVNKLQSAKAVDTWHSSVNDPSELLQSTGSM